MNKLQHLLLGGAMALPAVAFGQNFGHYPAGVEGLKAASLPPPGFYLRDYNYLYTASDLTDGNGDVVPADFQATVYVNAIRPVWITKLKLLGASYGMDVLVPIVYQDLKVGALNADNFALGDIFIEPVTLSWHLQQFDFSLGYGLWAPTANAGSFDDVGKGHLSHMFTAGGTVYFDAEKTWSFSALGRYELNSDNDDLRFSPGDVLSIEWGLGKALTPALEVGAVGYFQNQTTDSSGPGSALDLNDSLVGIGPEVALAFPKCGFFASLRYLNEVLAENRPQGHTFVLTLTKRF